MFNFTSLTTEDIISRCNSAISGLTEKYCAVPQYNDSNHIDYIYNYVYNCLPIRYSLGHFPMRPIDLIGTHGSEAYEAKRMEAQGKELNHTQTAKMLLEFACAHKKECAIFELGNDMTLLFYNRVLVGIENFNSIWNADCHVTILNNEFDLPKEIKDCIVFDTQHESQISYDYIIRVNEFSTKRLYANVIKDFDVKDNYNDDFPHQQFVNALNLENKSGIVIMHGAPGTGKSTYIRHLMSIMPNKQFIIADSSVFAYISDGSFIQLLMGYKDAVIVLEDCETLVKKRTEGNTLMTTLLNLTDGILADNFNFKFICTFNTPYENIDDALLRKGRLLFKYEFNPLVKEKVIALYDKLGVVGPQVPPNGDTVANIYNMSAQTSINQTTDKKKIGFSK